MASQSNQSTSKTVAIVTMWSKSSAIPQFTYLKTAISFQMFALKLLPLLREWRWEIFFTQFLLKPPSFPQGLLTVNKGALTMLNSTQNLCESSIMRDIMKAVQHVFGGISCHMPVGVICHRNERILNLKKHEKYIKIFGTGQVKIKEVMKHINVSFWRYLV